jgi:hypothetical protein
LPTRRKILEFVSQSEGVSYVDIRQAPHQANTGKLNYHLKTLGDLISKAPLSGKYVITDKGIAALNMTIIPKVTPSMNDKTIKSISMGSSRGLNLSARAGVVTPIILLSAMSYYLFFYLDIVKVSTILVNSIIWVIVLFLLWRGTTNHHKDEELLEHAGRGGK